eukprot:160778-Chlamydomonas_euryale.AAC.1
MRASQAKLLARNDGGVDRKLVKQTVMTIVYGVTEIGAGMQIGNRLRERGWANDAEVFQVWRVCYAVWATCVFVCVRGSCSMCGERERCVSEPSETSLDGNVCRRHTKHLAG